MSYFVNLKDMKLVGANSALKARPLPSVICSVPSASLMSTSKLILVTFPTVSAVT